jgi:hypothetical protein
MEDKMKKYPIKPTKKQLKLLKEYWKTLKQIQDDYYFQISILEKDMSLLSGIKDLEFFLSEDGYYCGIGNLDRTMNLIHANELEK